MSAPEVDKEVKVNLAVTKTISNLLHVEDYSNFDRMTRITAWIHRFVDKVLHKSVNTELKLTPNELMRAESHRVNSSQQEVFTSSISKLKHKQSLQASNYLSSLTPYLDSGGTLRVGGRLTNSRLPPDSMHLIIMKGNHHVTKLLISKEHTRLLHAGPTATFASISRRYHLLGGLRAVRSVTKSCVPCRRQMGRTYNPLTGQLPTDRVIADHPFNSVGVDFAGPFTVRAGCSKRSNLTKAYVCVFISMTVKAAHLELDSQTTSECFLASLRRFVSKRGIPKRIYSDNGTYFIKADTDLQKFCHYLSGQDESGEVSNYMANNRIEWHYIPQRSPHFGGLWEAAVRSTKAHLRRVLGDTRLNYEEMSTILSEVEACLNSRPLTSISTSDDGGVEPLTPGHFLIGRPLKALPDPAPAYSDLTTPKRWKLCQTLSTHWWKRWSNDYLRLLNRTYKGKFPSRNMKIGDVVLIHDWNLIKAHWPLGRIVEVFPGDDGVVRAVDVRTSKATYRRATVNLTPLVDFE